MEAVPIWMQLMIVLLGARPVDGSALEAPAGFTPWEGASCRVELNVDALRRLVREDEHVRTLVFRGQEPDVAYEEAIERLSGQIGVPVDKLRRISRRLRGVDLSVLAFGRRDDDLRVILRLDFGAEQDVIGPLDQPGVFAQLAAAADYAGGRIYHYGDLRDPVWLAEEDGKVAFAMDLPTAQEFLLDPGYAVSGGRAVRQRPLLRAEVDGRAMLSRIFQAVPGHDVDELCFAALAMDLASWRELTVTFDGERLEAALDFHPDSVIAPLLAGPDAPPKLAGRMSGAASVVVSLKDPDALMGFLVGAAAQGFRFSGDPGREQKGLAEWRHDLGVDLRADITANVIEAGVFLPSTQGVREWEDGLIVALRVRDAARARTSLSALIERMARGRRTVGRSTLAGADVTTVDEASFAVKDDLVVIYRKDNEHAEGFLHGPAEPTRAGQRGFPFADATSMAALDLSSLVPGIEDSPPLRAGLRYADHRLMLQARLPLGVTAAVLAQGLTGARESARRVACVSNLKQVALAVHMYAMDHADALPPNLNALNEYLGAPKLLRCPVSRRPYVFNKALAGRAMNTVEQTGRVPLAYDALAVHDNRRCVAFVDGHVEMLTNDELARLVEPAEATVHEDQPDAATVQEAQPVAQ